MKKLQITLIVISITALLGGLALLAAPRFLKPAETKTPTPATNQTNNKPAGGAVKAADVGKAGPGEKIIVLSQLGMT